MFYNDIRLIIKWMRISKYRKIIVHILKKNEKIIMTHESNFFFPIQNIIDSVKHKINIYKNDLLSYFLSLP